jgi:hypothetical protein
MDVSVSPMVSSRAREVVAVLAPAWGNAKGLIRKVALLEGELVEARRARDVARERVRHLLDSLAEGARWLVASEMERRE